MPRLIEAARKAVIHALLRLDPPLQGRIIAGCSVSQSTLTNWINKDKLVYVDFRRPGALAEWKRYQRAMLTKYGVNVRRRADVDALVDVAAKGACPLCGHDRALDDDWGEVEAEAAMAGEAGMAPQAPGHGAEQANETLSHEERLKRLSGLMMANADRIIERANRQDGVMNRAQIDTLLGQIRLLEKLGPLAEQLAGEQQEHDEAEIRTAVSRIEARVLELAACQALEWLEEGIPRDMLLRYGDQARRVLEKHRESAAGVGKQGGR